MINAWFICRPFGIIESQTQLANKFDIWHQSFSFFLYFEKKVANSFTSNAERRDSLHSVFIYLLLPLLWCLRMCVCAWSTTAKQPNQQREREITVSSQFKVENIQQLNVHTQWHKIVADSSYCLGSFKIIIPFVFLFSFCCFV